MRVVAVLALLAVAVLVLLSGCVSPPEKPVKDTTLEKHPYPAGDIDMNEWKAEHGEYVEENEETALQACKNCHPKPENFCNKCHAYVGGAPEIRY